MRVLSNRNTPLESIHYELLIATYLNVGDVLTPFNILCIMSSADIAVSRSTTRPLTLALQAAPPERTKEAFAHLRDMRKQHEKEKSGRAIPTVAMDVILEASVMHNAENAQPLTKEAAGNALGTAVNRYKHLHEICVAGPTVNTFNHLLTGCVAASPGQKPTAMFLASEMLALNIRPNAVTYDMLICICLADISEHEGQSKESRRAALDHARAYYEEMRAKQWLPSRSTFEKLVERNYRFRRDKEIARAMVRTMKENRLSVAGIEKGLGSEVVVG